MEARGGRLAQVAAYGTATLTVGMAVATFGLLSSNAVTFHESVAGFSLPFLPLVVAGAIVAARRPRLLLGWLLLLVASCLTGYAFLEQYATYALTTRPGAVPGGWLSAWLRVSLWVPGAVAFQVLLPLLFPTGAPTGRRWWAVAWVALGTGVVMMLLRQIAAWPLDGRVLIAPGEAWVDDAPLAQVANALFPVLLLCSVAAISSLLMRFRRASGAERLQLRWVMHGFTVFLALFLVSMALRDNGVGDVLVAVGVSAVAISFGVSVLRYRLYDIDRVVSRTISYATLSVVLVGVYLAGVITLQAAVRPFTGASDLAVAGSTLVVAALFQPARRRIQHVVDRRFNRSRYDGERLVARFAGRLRHQLELDTVSHELVALSVASLRPSSASIWLPSHGAPSSLRAIETPTVK